MGYIMGILFLGGNTNRFCMWDMVMQILPEKPKVLELPFFKLEKNVARPAFDRES